MSCSSSEDDPPACGRCGKRAPGRRQWMFYGYEWWFWLFGSQLRREFYCFRCRRIMRIYAIIALILAVMIIAPLAAVAIWGLYFQ